MFGWHGWELLLVEIGTLMVVWFLGTRGAGSSANLQTLIAGLVMALVAAIWWRGGISPAEIPFPTPEDVSPQNLFSALAVMFWCFVGLEAFAHLASEFKDPERDFPRALMIGLLLAGVVYWGCTVAVLHFNAFGAEKPQRRHCRGSSYSYLVKKRYGSPVLLAIWLVLLALIFTPKALLAWFGHRRN